MCEEVEEEVEEEEGIVCGRLALNGVEVLDEVESELGLAAEAELALSVTSLLVLVVAVLLVAVVDELPSALEVAIGGAEQVELLVGDEQVVEVVDVVAEVVRLDVVLGEEGVARARVVDVEVADKLVVVQVVEAVVARHLDKVGKRPHRIGDVGHVLAERHGHVDLLALDGVVAYAHEELVLELGTQRYDEDERAGGHARRRQLGNDQLTVVAAVQLVLVADDLAVDAQVARQLGRVLVDGELGEFLGEHAVRRVLGLQLPLGAGQVDDREYDALRERLLHQYGLVEDAQERLDVLGRVVARHRHVYVNRRVFHVLGHGHELDKAERTHQVDALVELDGARRMLGVREPQVEHVEGAARRIELLVAVDELVEAVAFGFARVQLLHGEVDELVDVLEIGLAQLVHDREVRAQEQVRVVEVLVANDLVQVGGVVGRRHAERPRQAVAALGGETRVVEYLLLDVGYLQAYFVHLDLIEVAANRHDTFIVTKQQQQQQQQPFLARSFGCMCVCARLHLELAECVLVGDLVHCHSEVEVGCLGQLGYFRLERERRIQV